MYPESAFHSRRVVTRCLSDEFSLTAGATAAGLTLLKTTSNAVQHS